MRVILLIAMAGALAGCQALSVASLGGVAAGVAAAALLPMSEAQRAKTLNESACEDLDEVAFFDSLSVADLAGDYVLPGGFHGSRLLRLEPEGALSYRVYDALFRIDTTVTGRWTLARESTGPHTVTLEHPVVTLPDGSAVEGDHSPILAVIRWRQRIRLVPLDREPYGSGGCKAFRPGRGR